MYHTFKKPKIPQKNWRYMNLQHLHLYGDNDRCGLQRYNDVNVVAANIVSNVAVANKFALVATKMWCKFQNYFDG